jgi:glycosyltransferase involved in cell wall biosynthesis
MAQAINSLLKDKEKRKKMGQAAQKWIDSKFSAQTMFEQISNLYRDLVTQSPA